MNAQKSIRPEKQAMVNEIKGKLDASEFLFLTNSAGMTMPELNELRGQLRNADAEFHIVKNRLLNKIQDGFGDALKGSTAMVTGSGDVVETAKILAEFAKAKSKSELKGGLFEGNILSAEDVVALSKLPPKEVMQAMLVGTLAAPMRNLVGVMNQKVCSLLYVLQAVKSKKEEA